MDKFSLDNAQKFEQHYNEDSFWRKLRQIASVVGRKVLYPALQLHYLLQDNHVPIKAKTMIIGALGYLILPTDLMPDFIPALGFTDDLTAIMVVLRALNKYITPEINERAKVQTDKLIGE